VDARCYVGVWGDPQDSTRGDTHYWGVWHSNKPFTAYLEVKSRFCSEFGFQSFPRFEQLQRIVPDDADEHLNMTSPFLEYKQRSPTPGNKGILLHVANHFRVPKSFKMSVYLSQLLQAISIKTACEHFRRQRPYCMGCLYWQLNDIWEGPSWSSLEYDGSWKILHYMTKNFYAKVLVSAVEVGDSIEFWLTNDFLVDLDGTLNAKVWKWDTTSSTPLVVIRHPTASPAATSYCCLKLNTSGLLGNEKRESVFLTIEFIPTKPSEDHNAFNTFFFSPLKSVLLQKPVIFIQTLEQTSVNTFKLSLQSNVVAPYVYLSSGDLLGRFSDNAFLLLPNVPVEIFFVGWKGNVTLEEFKHSTTVCSLRDSY